MKKIKNASELLWLMGMVFLALGVALTSKADLGVSMLSAPAFVVHDAVAPHWAAFSVGVSTYLTQGLALLIMCIVVGRFNWRYLLTFVVAVVYGYVLDLFLWILEPIELTAVWQNWLMLFAGMFATAIGVASFFRTYLPLQVFELFVSELSARFRLNINKTKWCFDITLLVLSVALALLLFPLGDFELKSLASSSFHSIGLGTLVMTAANSPLIAACGRVLDKYFDASPRFAKLNKALSLR